MAPRAGGLREGEGRKGEKQQERAAYQYDDGAFSGASLGRDCSLDETADRLSVLVAEHAVQVRPALKLLGGPFLKAQNNRVFHQVRSVRKVLADRDDRALALHRPRSARKGEGRARNQRCICCCLCCGADISG